jgi:integrase
MPRRFHVPQQSLHRPSGRSRVMLPAGPRRRIQVWLGPWGAPSTDAEYNRVLQLWLQAGRTWPPPALMPGTVRTVRHLAESFAAWASSYYVKNGRTTSTQHVVLRALTLLCRAGFDAMPVQSFGPKTLAAFQAWLAAHPTGLWSRSTINTYVQHVRAMFRWGVAQELVPEHLHRALVAVAPLRRGRSAAAGLPAPRENEPVPPVPLEHVRRVLPFMPPTVARAVQLHALTGCRVGELLAMRVEHLQHETGRPVVPLELDGPPPQVLVYLVPDHANKTEHHGRARRVYLGPHSCAVLWLELQAARRVEPLHAGTVVFSARRAERARLAALRADAKAAGRPVRRRVNPHVRAQVGDVYNRHSYRQAIRRACLAHNAQAEPSDHLPVWVPAQLRHTAATRIAAQESLEAARELLGHAELRTTLRYVAVDDARLRDAARRHG